MTIGLDPRAGPALAGIAAVVARWLQPPRLLLALGALTIAIGIPLADRRVPRNRWYGVRTRTTLGDQHIWYEVNALAGRDLVVLGVVLMMIALVVPVGHGVSPETAAMVGVAVFGAGAMVMLVRGLRLASRLRRERGDRPAEP